MRGIFLKIFFDSPEKNCSIIFSMYLISMTKKNQLRRYFIIVERIFPWFNIRPRSFPNRNCSWRTASKFSSLWFCFGLWSASKILRIQFQPIFFELNFWVFLLVVVQIRDQFVEAMRNSDPRVSLVSAPRHNSDLTSMFTVQTTGCNFQYGPNFGVSLDPAFPLWCCFFSWKSVFTTSHCTKLWEISSVFRNEICPNSTTFRNLASLQNLLNLSCRDNFSIRSPYCSNNRSLWTKVITIQRHFCRDHAWHEWRTWLPSHKGLPRSIVKGFTFFTHFCDCSVKTELIHRNNYSKNIVNRFQIGTIVYRQFSMAFPSESTSKQWNRRTENWTSAFCEFQHHSFRHIVPFSLWTIFFDRVPLLFGTKTNKWPMVMTKLSIFNTIQGKNVSQQNRDKWWNLLQGRRRTYRPLLQ